MGVYWPLFNVKQLGYAGKDFQLPDGHVFLLIAYVNSKSLVYDRNSENQLRGLGLIGLIA